MAVHSHGQCFFPYDSGCWFMSISILFFCVYLMCALMFTKLRRFLFVMYFLEFDEHRDCE